MSPEAERMCEELDAALFSGDTFHNNDDLASLRGYLARWQRRADEIRDEALIDE